MTPDEFDTPRAIYLAIILLFVLAGAVALRREDFARTARNILIWLTIFAGVFVLATYREDIGARVAAEIDPPSGRLTGRSELRIKAHDDGHFWVRAQVNGVPVLFLVDTGASDIVLSRTDAERVGIATGQLGFAGGAMTANGPVRTSQVRLERFALGPVRRDGIDASVQMRGLEFNLLGMAFLRTLKSWRVEGDTLILAA